LRVWDFKYGEELLGGVMRDYDRAFERANPGIRVEHIALSDVNDDAVLAAAIAANAAPDVVMVHAGAELQTFAPHFKVLDRLPLPANLAAYLPSVYASALEACRDTAGDLVAVPLTVQGFGWYYNKRLFSMAGLDPERPPRTWEAFLEACSQLEAAGLRPIAWGNNPPHGSDWLRRSFAASYYTNEELQVLFHSADFVEEERFALITSLIKELRTRGFLDSSGAYRDHIVDASRAFRQGEAGMYLGLFSDISHWKEFTQALGSDGLGFFGSIDLPETVGPSRACVQAAGVVYAVLNSSPLAKTAIDYVSGYLSPDMAAILVSQVGALVPLRGQSYPVEEYPVLELVLVALETGGIDTELYYPALSIKDALFRYDELFFNTQEISLETYLNSLGKTISTRDSTP
jgi:ABC-type glycerol-3-phosphate transport system substrate-binding protein